MLMKKKIKGEFKVLDGSGSLQSYVTLCHRRCATGDAVNRVVPVSFINSHGMWRQQTGRSDAREEEHAGPDPGSALISRVVYRGRAERLRCSSSVPACVADYGFIKNVISGAGIPSWTMELVIINCIPMERRGCATPCGCFFSSLLWLRSIWTLGWQDVVCSLVALRQNDADKSWCQRLNWHPAAV